MVAMVVSSIYEERRTLRHVLKSGGVRVRFVFLYRNTVFLRPWQIDPDYDTVRPKGAHDFICLPLLRLSLVG